MKKTIFILICFVVQGFISESVAQSSFGSESEVLKEAHNLYVSSEYADAMPLYAQLLSNHPNDPSYNYYYGVCILLSAKSKADAIKHLEAATSFKEAPSLLYYYLARAYHLDYQFQKAADQYQFFKSNSNPYYAKELHVDNLTEMCKTATGSGFDFEKSKEFIMAQTEADENTFMNAYVFTKNNGRFLLMPDKFTKGKLSKDKFSRYVFLSASGKLLVFTGAGSGHKTDIFISKRKSSKDWEDPQPIIFDNDGENDKMNPTIFENGDELIIYFSSNRNASIGGFDVFKSRGNLKTNKWSAPENAGVPVNSPEDDFYYVPSISEGIGYVSTKRNCNAQTLNVLKITVVDEPVKNILLAQIPIAKNEIVLKTDSIKPEIKIASQPSESSKVNQARLITESNTEAELPKERIKTDEVKSQNSSGSPSEKQPVTNAKEIDIAKQEVKVEEKEINKPVSKTESIKTEKPDERIDRPLTIKTKKENKILPRPIGEPDLNKLNRDYDTGLPKPTVAVKPVEIKTKPAEAEQPFATITKPEKTDLPVSSKEPDLSKHNRDCDTDLPTTTVESKAIDIKAKPVYAEQPLAITDKPEKTVLSASSKEPDLSKLKRDYDTGLQKNISAEKQAKIKPEQVELKKQPVIVLMKEEKTVLPKSSGDPDLSKLNHDYDTGIPKIETQREYTVKPAQVISQPAPTNNTDKTVLALSVKENKVEKVNQKNEPQVLKTSLDKKQVETNNGEIKVKGIFYCVDDPKSMNAKLIITEAANESKVYSAKTNSTTGEYELSLPAGGKYKFIIDKEGYSLLEQIVEIADGAGSVNQQLFLNKSKEGMEQFRIINGKKITTSTVLKESASNFKGSKLIYKIQIGAYSAKPTSEILQKYKDAGISNVSYVTRENGTRIFYTGSTTELSVAMSARQAVIEKNVPDAFIVVFSGENQITMEEALLTDR